MIKWTSVKTNKHRGTWCNKNKASRTNEVPRNGLEQTDEQMNRQTDEQTNEDTNKKCTWSLKKGRVN